jgi:DNA polymerase-3 subunit gamma/tau
LDAFHTKDTKTGLQLVGALVDQGVDMKYFLQSLMEELHRMLVAQVRGKAETAIFNLGELRTLFDLLAKAFTDMKVAVLPQLPLELAIIEYCQGTHVVVTKAAPQKEEDHSASEKMTPSEEVTVSSLRKQVGTLKKIQALYGAPKEPPKDNGSSEIDVTTIELMHAPADGQITKEWLAALWKHIINEMKQHNHTIAGVLRGCSIKSYDQKTLVILAGYKFHKERLDDIKTRAALIEVCKILTGNEIAVEVELKGN